MDNFPSRYWPRAEQAPLQGNTLEEQLIQERNRSALTTGTGSSRRPSRRDHRQPVESIAYTYELPGVSPGANTGGDIYNLSEFHQPLGESDNTRTWSPSTTIERRQQRALDTSGQPFTRPEIIIQPWFEPRSDMVPNLAYWQSFQDHTLPLTPETSAPASRRNSNSTHSDGGYPYNGPPTFVETTVGYTVNDHYPASSRQIGSEEPIPYVTPPRSPATVQHHADGTFEHNDVAFETASNLNPSLGGNPSSQYLEVTGARTRSILPRPPNYHVPLRTSPSDAAGRLEVPQSPGFMSVPTSSESGPRRGHRCEYCGRDIVNISRHRREQHGEQHGSAATQKFDCLEAGCHRRGSNGFTRSHNLKVHLRDVHGCRS
ncbi:hypothetical protein K440DRAFT_215074 [Wilcoxina mikolae CBS 423.85]|nr:hypothetical protein K440DRAFT_215074 [Wilcoxina mikolae CBS 423.85]